MEMKKTMMVILNRDLPTEVAIAFDPLGWRIAPAKVYREADPTKRPKPLPEDRKFWMN